MQVVYIFVAASAGSLCVSGLNLGTYLLFRIDAAGEYTPYVDHGVQQSIGKHRSCTDICYPGKYAVATAKCSGTPKFTFTPRMQHAHSGAHAGGHMAMHTNMQSFLGSDASPLTLEATAGGLTRWTIPVMPYDTLSVMEIPPDSHLSIITEIGVNKVMNDCQDGDRDVTIGTFSCPLHTLMLEIEAEALPYLVVNANMHGTANTHGHSHTGHQPTPVPTP